MEERPVTTIDAQLTFEHNIRQMELDSEKIRGRIINMTVNVENRISVILSQFFSNEEKLLLFDQYIMSDTLSFDQKKVIICSLIKDGKINLENYYSEYSADLQIVQDMRNLVAHTTLATTNFEVLTYNPRYIKYISFRRKAWESFVTILTEEQDEADEDIRNGKYSLYSFMKRVEKINLVKLAPTGPSASPDSSH